MNIMCISLVSNHPQILVIIIIIIIKAIVIVITRSLTLYFC